jgi:hypothetical protein
MTPRTDAFLSSSVTVAAYRKFEKIGDRTAIARFLKQRFSERFVFPIVAAREHKHGFCTMAICCLMVETLESFWQGWPETPPQKGASTFKEFFKRTSKLAVFQNVSIDFYKHIRCGILHQAETTGGWRIRRDGPLLNPATKTINATTFHRVVTEALSDYCDLLENSEWSEPVWKNFRIKMDAICDNAEEVALVNAVARAATRSFAT